MPNVVTCSNDSKQIYQSVNHYYRLNLQWTCVFNDNKIMFVIFLQAFDHP